MFALLAIAEVVSIRCVSYTVTVVGVGHGSVEMIVDQDVLVMVTVSSVTFKGNAVTAVKIDAIVRPM
jgi:hypothetical protein